MEQMISIQVFHVILKSLSQGYQINYIPTEG